MIWEFILTNTRKVQNGQAELRELAVLPESHTADINC